MQHFWTLILVAFCAIHLSSCKSECRRCCSPSEASKTAATAEEPELSAEELLAALGGHYFDVELPDDTPAKFSIRTALINSKGEILRKYGGMGVHNGAQSTRVFLFKDGLNMKEAIFIKSPNIDGIIHGSHYKGTVELPKHMSHMIYPQGKSIKPGEGMIRLKYEGTQSGGISGGKLTQEDTIDLTVIISEMDS